jgi:hypothetical protein
MLYAVKRVSFWVAIVFWEIDNWGVLIGSTIRILSGGAQ